MFQRLCPTGMILRTRACWPLEHIAAGCKRVGVAESSRVWPWLQADLRQWPLLFDGVIHVEGKPCFGRRPCPLRGDALFEFGQLCRETSPQCVAHRNHLLVRSFVCSTAVDQPGITWSRASNPAINSE